MTIQPAKDEDVNNEVTERPGPNTNSRAVAIFVGLVYFAFCVAILESANVPLEFAYLWVSLGTATIMITLTLSSYKWCLRRDSSVQFDLASIFLIVIPFAVYFSEIRHVIHQLPTSEFTILGWSAVVFWSLLFIVLSTVVLLMLAEALLWFGVQFFLSVRRRKQ